MNAYPEQRTENEQLNAARIYASRGWPVVPLHTPQGSGCTCGRPNCSHPGKHPRTRHGYKDATTDTHKIDCWWEVHPEANVGIATDDLLIFDFHKTPQFRPLRKSQVL
jgi:hypothetical protein